MKGKEPTRDFSRDGSLLKESAKKGYKNFHIHKEANRGLSDDLTEIEITWENN